MISLNKESYKEIYKANERRIEELAENLKLKNKLETRNIDCIGENLKLKINELEVDI